VQKERERADALAQGLSMTRSALYAYEAHARKLEDEAAKLRQAAASGAPSPRKSAQDGRDQTTRLEQDLVTARRDLDTQAALAARASEEVAQTRQTAERDSASLRSSLQQERARAEQLERDLALAKQVAPNAVTVGSIARDKPTENAKPVADRTRAVGVRGDAQPNSKEAAAVAAALLARGSALLGQGDIGAARIVLERAVEMGSVQASFSLAETYDPLILAKWGTLGTRGDAVRAQDLYAKADAAGIKEAKARIEALRR
jgi:small-conductance mechanosensitive channel